MENIDSYRDFAEKLTPSELQNLIFKIHEEKKWIKLTPDDKFFTALRNSGVSIDNEEEMAAFGEIIYKNLRRNFQNLPPYIVKIEWESGKSLENLDWIPGEPVAFDIFDPDWPSPFYITLPEKIVRGEQDE